MSDIAGAQNAFLAGAAALRSATSTDERILALSTCEAVTRQLEYLSIELVAALTRDGVFTERGYSRPALALADLLGCDPAVASRRVRVAEQICPRIGLDGSVLPARLAATAEAFAAGRVSLRHVEALAKALDSAEAARLAPEVWAGAEAQFAEHATRCTPNELAAFARDLLALLDQDGAEPDDHEPARLNELHLTRNAGGGGGRIKGQLDAPTFDAVATALDALSKPSPDELRTLPERQADALGEACRHALDDGVVGSTGGERPHLNVIIPLAELERRARGALLDFGGQLTPADLRMLCCDARVVPVVMGGNSEPLDVGRAFRTVTPHLRRAVTARDRGCCFPGCDRPPSWCDVHHLIAWELGGATKIGNLAMLCRVHHRLLHNPGWAVGIRDGQPEFIPPKWISPNQEPRRKPRPAATVVHKVLSSSDGTGISPAWRSPTTPARCPPDR